MDKWIPNKDEIRDGNKLIARFCGYEYFPYEEGKSVKDANGILVVQQWWGWHKPTKGHLKLDDWYLCRRHSELRFFNEWSWLYMAIDQIEKENSNVVTISTHYVTVFNRTYNVEIYGSKRATAWNAIVDFIKWRNGLQESMTEAEVFRKEYRRLHAACPKCGEASCISTLAGYILDWNKKEEYKDLNTCTCPKCNDVHTRHERVEIKQQ